MPPLPADSIHARACKLKCEKILTRPNLNQVAVHANTYGIYPSEIAALQKDYTDLWEPLSELLKKLSAVVEM